MKIRDWLSDFSFGYPGGHNLLILAHDLGHYMQLGTTIDDAIGEAYDKTARWLGLDMRKGGGPALEEIAREGDPDSVKFSVSSQLFYWPEVHCYSCLLLLCMMQSVSLSVKISSSHRCCFFYLWPLFYLLFCSIDSNETAQGL